MRKTWWHRWGLPMPMLIAILCFSHEAVAASHAAPKAAKKSKSETTVLRSPKSKAKSTQATKHAQPPKARTKHTLATTRRSWTKPRKAASSSKLRASAALRKSPSAATKSAKSRKFTKTRVLVLKETKNHKYVKMMVTVPDRSHRHSPPTDALPERVAPPQESTAASATTLAALTEPEPIMEAQPERRPLVSVGYTAGRAAFQVKFNGERLLHHLNSAFVLPGDEIFVEVVDSQKKRDYTLQTTLGAERQLGPTRWYWHAPSSPGVYSVKVQRPRSHTTVTLNVFVMVPLDRVEDDGMLNGYRIGHYPTVALRQQAIYTPPRGLIEVTPDIENMLVSPHFRLQQFLCKQDGDYPKYMILDTRLLNALELLLEKANAHGYPTRTLTVMSGYRTPYYNRAIGNSTTYSRHVWGDAADIFIDENPQDGRMDDLNQDGEVDTHDAQVLYDLIESQYDSRFQKLHVGGLARYRETSSHGPFVHVDVRGVEARWGAGGTAQGATPSTQPVALRDNRFSPQPAYWGGKREAESAP